MKNQNHYNLFKEEAIIILELSEKYNKLVNGDQT